MELLARSRLIVSIVLALAWTPLQAAPPSPNEYSLKAVFLYNFCRFIDWPPLAFHSPNDPLDHRNHRAPIRSARSSRRRSPGRIIGAARSRSSITETPREIRQCQLVFVSQGDESQTGAILAAVAGRNILTVGETESFLDHGGMIALTAEQNRVRLRINPTALRATKLSVSSKLLQVAEIRS